MERGPGFGAGARINAGKALTHFSHLTPLTFLHKNLYAGSTRMKLTRACITASVLLLPSSTLWLCGQNASAQQPASTTTTTPDAAELADDHPAWALEAEYLALGILSIVTVVSPHRVIAGGGVMERAGLLPAVRARLRALVGGYLETPLLDDRIDEYVVAPELGDRAGVLGAIALATGT